MIFSNLTSFKSLKALSGNQNLILHQTQGPVFLYHVADVKCFDFLGHCITTLLVFDRSLSLGACNYPTFLSRRFHRPIYFQFEIISNSDPHGNLSDQLQSQAWTNVDITTRCRHVHVRPHCLILTEACSCRLELAYLAGNMSKNRLVCKNAVALAHYGSCWLPVMGSCSLIVTLRVCYQ